MFQYGYESFRLRRQKEYQNLKAEQIDKTNPVKIERHLRSMGISGGGGMSE